MSPCQFPDPPLLKKAGIGPVMDYFRSYLQQVVTIHAATFQKLLFEADDVPLELAELFEDAGNTYLQLSESISRRYFERRLSKVEEQLDASVEPALRRVKAQPGAKPGVRRAKHLAQPVEN